MSNIRQRGPKEGDVSKYSRMPLAFYFLRNIERWTRLLEMFYVMLASLNLKSVTSAIPTAYFEEALFISSVASPC